VAADRSIRSLTALNGASTSRVLNLAFIAAANVDNPEHRSMPLFRSPIINASVLLKHRVRSDETYVFVGARTVATKIIVPFDQKDMRTGGRSILIDQRGYRDALCQIGIYNAEDLERDLQILCIFDRLPSLDPFLIREHLRAAGVECAPCYLEIARADQERMFAFVSAEIHRLISLASAGKSQGSTGRMVSALLSTSVDEKLEPLRLTLNMSPTDFREGVFSWRGFLYYKWCIEEKWPEIVDVLRDVRKVDSFGTKDPELNAFLTQSRRTVIEKVSNSVHSIRKTLGVYDRAYSALVENQTPNAFRDFLLGAPHLFLDLGEKMGAISHIASFWRYRFPRGAKLNIDSEELAAIFQDFISNFAPAEGALLRA